MINHDFFNDKYIAPEPKTESKEDLKSGDMYPPVVDMFKDAPPLTKKEPEIIADKQPAEIIKESPKSAEPKVDKEAEWSSKFKELEKEKAQYKKDLDAVNKYINEFAAKSKTNPLEAFEYLAGSVGLDTLDFKKNMRNEFMKNYGKFATMTESERQIAEMAEENEHYKNAKERDKEQKQKDEERNLFQSEIVKLQQEHSIDDGRLNELVGDLKKYNGNVDVSMNDVVELHHAYARQDRAISTLNAIDKDLLTDDSKLIMLESILSSNPKMTDIELQSYAEKLWKPEIAAKANLEKKTSKKEIAEPKIKATKKDLSIKRMGNGGNVDFF